MAEDFVQVAPDSTGAKVRTRSRVIGANTVEEQYVIVQPEAVAINRVWFSTLRIPNTTTASAALTPLLYIWNGIASGGNSVSVRRFGCEIDAVGAWVNPSPVLRMFRMSTVSGTPGGAAVPTVQQYSSDPAFSASVAVRAAISAENTFSALTLGTLNTNPMWSQTFPRMATAVGFYAPTEYNLLPNDGTLMAQDPLILRPQEGVAVQMLNTHSAALTAGLWTMQFKAVLAEFTYP